MTRAVGIDLAKYDNPFTPKGNIDFVVQRLSYGTLKDERLADLTPAVMTIPVKGAYHYYTSGSRWQDQCDLFLSLAGGKYDFLALDVEKRFNYPSSIFLNGISPAMEYLIMQSKKPVLLYLNPDIWTDPLWLNDKDHPVNKTLLQYDIWLAQYYFLRRDTAPIVPATMTQGWKFWQWNDIGKPKTYGTGGSTVDIDVFNGTVDDLHAWAHPIPMKVCPLCGGLGKVSA
jgi:GH25 family lysozyme M1 (1,4-beta-N-acetylmuramidase)